MFKYFLIFWVCCIILGAAAYTLPGWNQFALYIAITVSNLAGIAEGREKERGDI